MLGLFVYFYVVLHLLSYSWFDMGFDMAEIAKDIAKRPFILVGFTGFRAADAAGRDLVQPRRQGAWARNAGRRCTSWSTLIAGLGILHFFWMRAGKNDFAEVVVYAAIVWPCCSAGASGTSPAREAGRSGRRCAQPQSLSAARCATGRRPSRVADQVGAVAARPALRRRGRGCCSCWPCSCSRRRRTGPPAGRPACTASARSRPIQSPLSQTGPDHVVGRAPSPPRGAPARCA